MNTSIPAPDHMLWKVLGSVALAFLAWALGRATKMFEARLDLFQKAGSIYFRAMHAIYGYHWALWGIEHPYPVDPALLDEPARVEKANTAGAEVRVAIADAIALRYVLAAVFRRGVRERWQTLIDALRTFEGHEDQDEWRTTTHKLYEQFAADAIRESGYYWLLRLCDEWWPKFKSMLCGGNADQQ